MFGRKKHEADDEAGEAKQDKAVGLAHIDRHRKCSEETAALEKAGMPARAVVARCDVVEVSR